MINKLLSVIFVLLAAVDIITKRLVVNLLKPLGEVKVIDGFFYLSYVENRGMAFGMFKGARWIFIIATIIVLGVIIYYFLINAGRKTPVILRLCGVLIGAGAFGNLTDRIFFGYVVDFLRFVFFGHSFAVFNFADILVCTGAGLLCLYLLFCGEKGEVNKNEA